MKLWSNELLIHLTHVIHLDRRNSKLFRQLIVIKNPKLLQPSINGTTSGRDGLGVTTPPKCEANSLFLTVMMQFLFFLTNFNEKIWLIFVPRLRAKANFSEAFITLLVLFILVDYIHSISAKYENWTVIILFFDLDIWRQIWRIYTSYYTYKNIPIYCSHV